MGGAEGVVDVDIGQVRQLLGKGGVVLFLFLMEADVLQQHGLSLLQGGGQGLGALAHHVGGQLDLLAQQLGEALGHGR